MGISVAEFIDRDAINHETIFQQMLLGGIAIDHYPLWSDVGITPDWLRIHAAEHQAWAALTGLAAPPDLTDLDPENVQQFMSWAYDHYLHTSRVMKYLGL